MFGHYTKFNKAEKYIIGFAHKGMVYMEMVEHIDPEMVTLESASKNQGVSLRFRPKSAHKAEMLMEAICLGTVEMLLDEKYNTFYFKSIGNDFFAQGKPLQIGATFNINL